MDPIYNGLIFLISTLFDLYIFILITRLILVWTRADYFNPLSQLVTRLTGVIISPVRRFIPNVYHIELSTLLVIILLSILKFLLIGLISLGFPNLFGLFILAIADVVKTLLNLFFYAILIQVILSWVQPGFSPIGQVLNQITAPIMRPIRRLIPPVGGFDISPIPVLILLQLLTIILAAPLFKLGMQLAFGN